MTRPSPACIQIWSLSPSKSSSQNPDGKVDEGQMKCEMVLCVDSGPAFDLKWCPLPSHDAVGISKNLTAINSDYFQGQR